MFCSPIQQVDPLSYSYWSPAPSRGYRQSCRDSHARAVLQEQARREALAERKAYETYMRKEAERRRAAEEEAKAVQYKKAVMERIMRAYAAQAQAERVEQASHVHPSQSKIPIFKPSTSDHDAESDTEQDEESDDDEVHHSDEASTSEEQHNEIARDIKADKPKISYEEAVAIVHKHAQIALTIRRRLSSLNKIRDSFQAQQRAFRPPHILDFDSRKSQQAGQPVLAYTPNNRPLQAYEESLLRLLTDLDDIPSGGLSKVKNARKALARTIQSELDKVDNYKMRQWQARR